MNITDLANLASVLKTYTDSVKAVLLNKLNKNDTAVAAAKLATARTISLGGDVSGSVNFDGTANVTLSAQVADDSHNHVISNVDGLQTALDGKLGKTETAVNSNKLEGYTRTEVLSQAYAQVGTMGKRNVFISPNDPAMTDGAVGDIWLKY